MSEPSIFTRILNGEIPSEIIYKDDLVFAIKDINPQAPTHVLIIPQEPLVSINDIDESNVHIAGRLLLAAKKVAEQLGVANDGYRLVINTGRDGGQDVMHIHMHLMSGRKMGWPPG